MRDNSPIYRVLVALVDVGDGAGGTHDVVGDGRDMVTRGRCRRRSSRRVIPMHAGSGRRAAGMVHVRRMVGRKALQRAAVCHVRVVHGAGRVRHVPWVDAVIILQHPTTPRQPQNLSILIIHTQQIHKHF